MSQSNRQILPPPRRMLGDVDVLAFNDGILPTTVDCALGVELADAERMTFGDADDVLRSISDGTSLNKILSLSSWRLLSASGKFVGSVTLGAISGRAGDSGIAGLDACRLRLRIMFFSSRVKRPPFGRV